MTRRDRTIGEDRERTRALESERERLSVAISHVAGTIFSQDRALRYTWMVNPIPPMNDADAVIGHTDVEILGLEAGGALEALKARVLAGEEIYDEIPIEYEGVARIFEAHYRPQHDPDGTIIGLLGFVRDVTVRRREEQEAAARSRAEALALLAGGAAHDLGNILAALTANLSLAQLELGAGHPALAPIERANASVAAAAAMTRQLLGYAGQTAILRGPVDLRDVAREVISLIEPMIGAGISLRTALDTEPARVEGDPTALVQVLLNLLRNALDSLESAGRGGLILLRIDRQPRATFGPGWEMSGAVPEGSVVIVEVVDDGPGVSRSVRHRLFEPFVSSKQMGRGLGLAAAAGIAREHGGAIAARCDPGGSTLFRLVLPAIDDRGLMRRRLLYVEDDEAVRPATAALLECYDWSVMPVVDATAAIAILRADAESYAALLTDLELPGGGESIATAAREVHPELPVVFTSAWTGRLAEAAAKVSGAQAVPKPARADDLVEALEAACADPLGAGRRERRWRRRRA
jgi:two-component system cell cycle sensor histidine kinase/response regulator CckA